MLIDESLLAVILAKILGVGVGLVRQLVASGQLPAEKRGRDYLIAYDAVKARADNPPKAGRKAGRPRKEPVAA